VFTWGRFGVGYIDKESSDYGQAIIARGVEKIYQLSQATTYCECRRHFAGDVTGPSRSFHFIGLGLTTAAQCVRSGAPLLVPYGQLSERNKALIIGRAFFKDPDGGPKALWEWLHRNSLEEQLVSSPEDLSYRRWAYPFWDNWWLSPAFFENNDIIQWIHSRTEELETYQHRDQQLGLQQSQLLRMQLYKEGRRGWFSLDGREEDLGF
jgi:hypothetical protein